ncbi:carbohydrate ABC transporter permease [Anaerocolumna xylanovorans]|uniref:Putative aldouronate transport system permease protein n=1 Tax=Anaerocolumna xylanovorans DSM 12503 TaxID=1121345 RepID=A0A1M7YMU1_9FIRM|nr:carbohydrate ABC transporter permease [Anaerocolumna xylanovorans]SHO53888.1 putative aldouronate transport system permease protein [Anaerocolumna xylanovorans DSM 12503]
MIEHQTLGSKIFDVINLIVLIVITLLCIIPLWYILCISLSNKTAVDAGIVSFWPVGFNLFSYERIMGEKAFFVSFWISIKRVVLGGIVGVGCILLVAYPLSKSIRQFPKRNLFMWILVFCMLFNGGTVPWYLTMKNYHLIDNIWGLVLAGSLPVFSVILVMNFFRNLPGALEEAAYVDGAGPWKTFFSIFIPLSKPVIATIVLFTIVGHWNEFFQGLVLSTKQANYPVQTYIQQMVVTTDFSTMNVEQIQQALKLNNKSLDAAKVFIAIIPILIIYPFLQKYFVTGITLGSVKE